MYLTKALKPKFIDELIPDGVSFKSMRDLPSALPVPLPTSKVMALQETKFMKAREIQNAIMARKNVIKVGGIRLKNLGKRLLKTPSMKDKLKVKAMMTKVSGIIAKATADLAKESGKLTKLVASTPTPMKPLIAAGVAVQTARQIQAKAYYNKKFKKPSNKRKLKIEAQIRDVKEKARLSKSIKDFEPDTLDEHHHHHRHHDD